MLKDCQVLLSLSICKMQNELTDCRDKTFAKQEKIAERLSHLSVGEGVQLLWLEHSRHRHTTNSLQLRHVRSLVLPHDGLACLGRDARLSLSLLPGHPVTLPNMSIEVAHAGASVATDRAAEGLLSSVHPDKTTS